MKAVSLGLIGRYEEGKKSVESPLKAKPDFRSRGRVLIGHYIKLEEIVNRVIEGLRKLRLNI